MFHWLEELLTLRLKYLTQCAHIKGLELADEAIARSSEQQLIDETMACKTCDVLKLELAKAHDENQRLIGLITTKPEVEAQPTIEGLKPILPARHMPFHARRQMMEQEDRAKARVIRESAELNLETVLDETLTATLERELNIVESERGAESGVRE